MHRISPLEFDQNNLYLAVNQEIDLTVLKARLVALGYERKDYDLAPGTFKIHDEIIEIMLGYSADFKVFYIAIRIENISDVHSHTHEVLNKHMRIILRSANGMYLIVNT